MEVKRRMAILSGSKREVDINLRDAEIDRMMAILRGRWDPFSQELLRLLERA